MLDNKKNIDIFDFCSKIKTSVNNSDTMKRMYSKKNMTEKQWDNFLSKEFNYTFIKNK